jgi:subtilisin family serine protease
VIKPSHALSWRIASFGAVGSVLFAIGASLSQSGGQQVGVARAASAVSSSQRAIEEPAAQASTSARAHFRPGVVLVGFRPGLSARQRYATEREAGAEDARQLGPPLQAPPRSSAGRKALPAPMLLRVPPTQVLAVVRRLRRSHAVAYAEPDYLMSGDATPTDLFFSLQWGASNVGQPIPTQNAEEELGLPANGTPGADDGALKAWQTSTGSRSIVIGETDTGVDFSHPDLAANIWSNPGGVGGCAAGTHGYDVLSKACNPMDEDTTYGGHGTHVAGIMGAVGNNGIGVAGMNWQTTILPVKWMTNASSGSTSALIEAMQWLVAAKQAGVNVRVVNDSDSFFGTARSQALSNEIDLLGANNILFVASAGNTGDSNDEVAVQRYPCSYDRPTEICVTASNNNDQLPSWANIGPHTVDLAAPGVSIYSTLREGRYGYLSGGSMAAPEVAGAAALILSIAPALSAAALKADILDNVDALPALSGRVITGGRLDVDAALRALPSPSAVPLPSQPPLPIPSQSAPPPVGAATQAGGQPPVQSAAVAVISGLSISPPALAAARSGPTIGRRGVSGGASVSYSDSEPALVRFTVWSLRSGFESPDHTCATSAHGRPRAGGRRCTRYVKVGSFAHQDRAGRNSFRFSGRIDGRKLASGRYRLQAVPASGGRAGVGRVVVFRIVG